LQWPHQRPPLGPGAESRSISPQSPCFSLSSPPIPSAKHYREPHPILHHPILVLSLIPSPSHPNPFQPPRKPTNLQHHLCLLNPNQSKARNGMHTCNDDETREHHTTMTKRPVSHAPIFPFTCLSVSLSVCYDLPSRIAPTPTIASSLLYLLLSPLDFLFFRSYQNPSFIPSFNYSSSRTL